MALAGMQSLALRRATSIESKTEIGDVMACAPSRSVSEQAGEFLPYLVEKRDHSIL